MPTVHCKSCRRLLDIGSAFVGRHVMCPSCLGPVSVPFLLNEGKNVEVCHATVREEAVYRVLLVLE